MAFVTVTVKGMDSTNKLVMGFAQPNIAISRAINKGVAKARTESWAVVKPLFPIKQNQFYSGIKVVKSGVQSLEGRMTAYSKKFSYVDVGGATQLKKGVRVQPRKGARKTSADLFFKRGTKTILTQKKTGSGVESVRTFSVAQMLDEPPGTSNNALWRAQEAAADAYEKELLRQIDLIASKK